MGNALGRDQRKAKIMKIDGQIFKLKMPATAMDVLKDYPTGYVLLELEAVKKYGVRAPKLHPQHKLNPGKIYFLLQLPKFPECRTICAKERLESQRSAIDVGSGSVRVKMRLPRAEVDKLLQQSKDEAEVAHRILNLCLNNSPFDQSFANFFSS